MNFEANSDTLQKRLLTHEGREPFELVRRSKPPKTEATRSTLLLLRERTASPRLNRSPVPITTARPLISERVVFSLFVMLVLYRSVGKCRELIRNTFVLGCVPVPEGDGLHFFAGDDNILGVQVRAFYAVPRNGFDL